jgi:hypothetical protein
MTRSTSSSFSTATAVPTSSRSSRPSPTGIRESIVKIDRRVVNTAALQPTFLGAPSRLYSTTAPSLSTFRPRSHHVRGRPRIDAPVQPQNLIGTRASLPALGSPGQAGDRTGGRRRKGMGENPKGGHWHSAQRSRSTTGKRPSCIRDLSAQRKGSDPSSMPRRARLPGEPTSATTHRLGNMSGARGMLHSQRPAGPLA